MGPPAWRLVGDTLDSESLINDRSGSHGFRHIRVVILEDLGLQGAHRQYGEEDRHNGKGQNGPAVSGAPVGNNTSNRRFDRAVAWLILSRDFLQDSAEKRYAPKHVSVLAIGCFRQLEKCPTGELHYRRGSGPSLSPRERIVPLSI